MMLRLALVGIVAALGVTLPSQTECDNWFTKTEQWANSFLADWDSWRPREHGVRTEGVATTDHECEQCRLAQLEVARKESTDARSAAIETSGNMMSVAWPFAEGSSDQFIEDSPAPVVNTGITSEPVAATDVRDAGIAFELDWKAGGIDVAESPAPLTASGAEAEWAALAKKLAPTLLSESWGPLNESVSDRRPTTVVVRTHEQVEPAIMDALDLTDADDNDQPFTLIEAPAATAKVNALHVSEIEPLAAVYGPELFEAVARQMDQWRADAPLTAVKPIANVPAVEGLKVMIDVPSTAPTIQVEPIAADAVAKTSTPSTDAATALPWPVFSVVEPVTQAPTEIVHESTVPWPVFAPTEAALAPEPATAQRSIQPGNGCEVAQPPVFGPVASPAPIASHEASFPQPALAQAVRLTQEAMRAWVGVLARPARVEVTVR